MAKTISMKIVQRNHPQVIVLVIVAISQKKDLFLWHKDVDLSFSNQCLRRICNFKYLFFNYLFDTTKEFFLQYTLIPTLKI